MTRLGLTEVQPQPQTKVLAAPPGAGRASIVRGSQSVAIWLGCLTFAFSALLAYRWQSPIGSITPSRIGLIVMFCVLWPIIVKWPIHRRGEFWLMTQVFLIAVLGLGLLYTSEMSLGLTAVLEHVEAAGTFVLFYVLVRHRSGLNGRLMAMLPLIAYLPSGVLAIYQAAQLAAGRTPTIPFIELVSLNDATLNSARTAFGSGLDAYGIDRIASATGDPPTFGILSALVVIYFLWVREVVPNLPGIAAAIVLWVALVGVFLSQSISAVLVLTAGATIQWVAHSLVMARRGRQSVGQNGLLRLGFIGVTLIVVGVIFARAFQPFVDSVLARFATLVDGNGSIDDHLALLSGAWRIFTDHPVFGIGTGGGSSAYFGSSVPFSSFHSVVLLRLAENGVLGLVAVLLAWAALARYVPIAVMIASLVAWSTYFDWDRLPFLWCLLGVAAALHAQASLVATVEANLKESQMVRSTSIASPASDTRENLEV